MVVSIVVALVAGSLLALLVSAVFAATLQPSGKERKRGRKRRSLWGRALNHWIKAVCYPVEVIRGIGRYIALQWSALSGLAWLGCFPLLDFAFFIAVVLYTNSEAGSEETRWQHPALQPPDLRTALIVLGATFLHLGVVWLGSVSKEFGQAAGGLVFLAVVLTISAAVAYGSGYMAYLCTDDYQSVTVIRSGHSTTYTGEEWATAKGRTVGLCVFVVSLAWLAGGAGGPTPRR